MSFTTAGNLTAYNPFREAAFLYRLTQRAAVLNEASAGAFILDAGGIKGRTPKITSHLAIPGMVTERDPDSDADATPTNPSNVEEKSVNCFRKVRHKLIYQAWLDQAQTPERAAALYGIQQADGLVINAINTGVAALVGAISAIDAVSGVTAIHNAAANFTYDDMNTTLGLAGDMRSNVTTLFAHSKAHKDLIANTNTSQQIAFQVGGFTIPTGAVPSYGLVQAITDDPSLFITPTSGTKYRALHLQPGAVTLGLSDVISRMEEMSSRENITDIFASDWHLTVSVKGCSYTGAIKPNLAALATPGNWTSTGGTGNDVSKVKDGPGVMCVSD